MKKSYQEYIVDVILAISFLLAGITGIVKLPKLGIELKRAILFTKIHDISGIIMVVLVLIHLIQHWKWIIVMTKQIFSQQKVKKVSILALAILLTISVTLITTSIFSNSSVNNSLSSEYLTQSNNENLDLGINSSDCPHGITDDPAPGLCGLYVDKNNDGLCDHGE